MARRLPWHEPPPGPRTPYWLRPRDLEVERLHVKAMRKFERDEKVQTWLRGRRS